jgi:predicted DsbA family dithiol-disulfide isomerase
MEIEVWSDVVCPWCYIGKRRLESALERYPGRDAVTVRYRSFQLDPSSPKGSDERVMDSLSRKYRVPAAQAAAMQANVVKIAAGEGLEFNVENSRVENTLDAHRLLHLAAAHGKQLALKERLLAANFCDGERVGDAATLQRLGEEVGLDAAEVRAVLADPTRYADAVAADQRTARELGVQGVPFFVFARKVGVSGAQPVETLLAALARAGG